MTHPWSRALRAFGKRMKKPADPIPRWKIVKGDTVQVIDGKKSEIGKSGIVQRVDRRQNKLYVEGVNEHTRRVKDDETGQVQMLQSPAPIHYSNVALLDPKDGHPCRVKLLKVEKEINGVTRRVRERYSTRTGAMIPKPAYERRDGMTRAAYKESHLDTSADVLRAKTYTPTAMTFEESVMKSLIDQGLGVEEASSTSA
eukprot:TRINITY_DN9095_c0_g1_i2.p1 TRINITY_DN9095_c0_g1~~TRINITY_DN9095_c0_g1_i2.p1  ORF type:complete len:199 (+),score=37.86 TRINITY_DN9095_c0_g1_i2:47-643(+)